MSWIAVLVVFFAVATLVILFVGLLGFARGGEFNRKYGNVIMRYRVGFQLVAILLLMLMFFLADRS